jgi:hypothetical protein
MKIIRNRNKSAEDTRSRTLWLFPEEYVDRQCNGYHGMSLLSGLTVLTPFQDHISAVKAFKHLKPLSLPSVFDLGLVYYGPPRCRGVYRGTVREQAKMIAKMIAGLMHGINMEVIMQEGSTLCKVALGQRDWGEQIIWERGEKGELYESKAVERS